MQPEVQIVRFRWSDSQWQRLQDTESNSEGRLKLHTLKNAGHWLHADNPEGLRQLFAMNLLKEAPYTL